MTSRLKDTGSADITRVQTICLVRSRGGIVQLQARKPVFDGNPLQEFAPLPLRSRESSCQKFWNSRVLFSPRPLSLSPSSAFAARTDGCGLRWVCCSSSDRKQVPNSMVIESEV
jgi:hypothetical protein